MRPLSSTKLRLSLPQRMGLLSASAMSVVVVVVLALGLSGAEAAPWIPKSLECTPWSWQLCRTAGKGTFQVDVSAEGGGGMQAPGHYMTGYFSLDMKLPAGNSGGVNFAWYLMDTISPSNKDPRHSEIDFEFYGNATGEQPLLALNLFANGKQNLAQFRLPFDPSAAVHTYAIRWTRSQIVWLVDRVPIRIITRQPGQPWPRHAMKPMASVWATPWTPLQADFSNGPISALYGNYRALGCVVKERDVMRHGGPGQAQCPGPWNARLTAAQIAAYQKLNTESLLVDYGWEEVYAH